MQKQDGNDPHSFSLPLDDRKRNVPSPPSSSTAAAAAALEQEEIIAKAFAQDGFFVLRQCFDTDLLLPFREFGNAYFAECFQDLYDHDHIPVPSHRRATTTTSSNDVNAVVEENADTNKQRYTYTYTYTLQQGVTNGFREIVMRSPGRYELSLLHLDWNSRRDNHKLNDYPRLDTEIPLLVEPLKSLLPRLVGPDYTQYEELKLCHLSLLIATPGSSDQSWHADGGHVDISKHLPCHCFNVFFPLQDTPKILGPTEIRPASHFLTRNLGPMMLAAKCRKTLKSPVWPELAFGDAIVLDYRVLHRGRANQSDDDVTVTVTNMNNKNKDFIAMNRNYLVLSYSEPWFQDVLNFPKRSMYSTYEKQQQDFDEKVEER